MECVILFLLLHHDNPPPPHPAGGLRYSLPPSPPRRPPPCPAGGLPCPLPPLPRQPPTHPGSCRWIALSPSSSTTTTTSSSWLLKVDYPVPFLLYHNNHLLILAPAGGLPCPLPPLPQQPPTHPGSCRWIALSPSSSTTTTTYSSWLLQVDCPVPFLLYHDNHLLILAPAGGLPCPLPPLPQQPPPHPGSCRWIALSSP